MWAFISSSLIYCKESSLDRPEQFYDITLEEKKKAPCTFRREDQEIKTSTSISVWDRSDNPIFREGYIHHNSTSSTLQSSKSLK